MLADPTLKPSDAVLLSRFSVGMCGCPQAQGLAPEYVMPPQWWWDNVAAHVQELSEWACKAVDQKTAADYFKVRPPG